MTAVCERATLCLGMALAALAAALLVPGLARAGFAPDATVHTETTQYTYNADGALTAQRTTLDAGSAQDTYFTWDNFLPATADPSSGTVSAANGNLLGYGAAPGSTATAAFTFDRRNRLTAYAGAGRQVAYAYTAGGLLAAATPATGSGLRFYHDDAAQMTNLRQDAGTSTELWSGDLGRVRYLGDGAEQVLLRRARTWPAPTTPAQRPRRVRVRRLRRAVGGAAAAQIRPARQSDAVRRRVPRPAVGRLLPAGALVRTRTCRVSCRAIRWRISTATATPAATR